MNNTPHDGGPAFPHEDTMSTGFRPGMSLRDYFIAHAPAEPQPWFDPTMLPPPARPESIKDATDDERQEMEGLGEFLAADDCRQPRVRAYAERLEAHEKAVSKWRREKEKQHYIQWPAAWADAMLAERTRVRLNTDLVGGCDDAGTQGVLP